MQTSTVRKQQSDRPVFRLEGQKPQRMSSADERARGERKTYLTLIIALAALGLGVLGYAYAVGRLQF